MVDVHLDIEKRGKSSNVVHLIWLESEVYLSLVVSLYNGVEFFMPWLVLSVVYFRAKEMFSSDMIYLKLLTAG